MSKTQEEKLIDANKFLVAIGADKITQWQLDFAEKVYNKVMEDAHKKLCMESRLLPYPPPKPTTFPRNIPYQNPFLAVVDCV